MSDLKYTIADVAERRGVSERAIYKQLKSHEKELEGHIQKYQGKQWLDEYAVELLEKAASNSAPVIVEDSKKTELEELQKACEALKAERDAEYQSFRKIAETMTELMTQHIEDQKLIAETKLYLEQRDHAQEERDRIQKELEEQRAAAERLAEEMEAEKQQKAALQMELESALQAEQTRRLTWKERLLGRKG